MSAVTDYRFSWFEIISAHIWLNTKMIKLWITARKSNNPRRTIAIFLFNLVLGPKPFSNEFYKQQCSPLERAFLFIKKGDQTNSDLPFAWTVGELQIYHELSLLWSMYSQFFEGEALIDICTCMGYSINHFSLWKNFWGRSIYLYLCMHGLLSKSLSNSTYSIMLKSSSTHSQFVVIKMFWSINKV